MSSPTENWTVCGEVKAKKKQGLTSSRGDLTVGDWSMELFKSGLCENELGERFWQKRVDFDAKLSS